LNSKFTEICLLFNCLLNRLSHCFDENNALQLSYATFYDYFFMIFGTFVSVVHGVGFPLLSVVLGNMTNVFLRAQISEFVTHEAASSDDTLEPISEDDFKSEVKKFCLYYLIIGVAMFVTSYVQIWCFESFAERTTHKLRRNYLKAILRQEIAWFDKEQTGSLTSRLTDDLERVREGIGDKLSILIQLLATFVAGFIVAFTYNWRMTLVMMAFTPLLAGLGGFLGRVVATRTQVEQEKYAFAGAIAEETFSSIRTVLSLNGYCFKRFRYEKALEESKRTGRLKYLYMGLGVSLMYLTTYASYAVAFWYGSKLIVDNADMDRGTVFTVFFSVMSGSTALGAALPNVATFGMAKGAARKVLSVINCIPAIDPYSPEGEFPAQVKGAISFKNVEFSYPIRKNIKILDKISFNIEAGKKVALVGTSGCGKSTSVNLLLRFYDPDNGQVTLDGYDLKSLNVRQLRDSIGIVSQEPILFDGTIASNIRLGKDDATRDEIINACKLANAWHFIDLLPNGLDTHVGERGVQLSGGQKQRIAIARALIKNPSILLLDEATSALDTESESVVQRALEQAQKGRTTISVAHRLSTVKDCDEILVFQKGRIIERGTHEELIQLKGVFYKMVLAQSIHQNQNENEVPSTEGHWSRKTSILSSYRSRRSTRASTLCSEEQSLAPTSMAKIFKVNKDCWFYWMVGFAGSFLTGIVPPFFSLVYSQIFDVYSLPANEIGPKALFWSMMFLVCGVVSAAGFFIASNMLGLCGETLTKKLRLMAFINLMRQDIAFYDDPKHATGKLCTRFATDAPNVRYVFTRLPAVISSIVTLFGAIIIGFVYGWQLALVLLVIIPLILGSGYFQMKMQFGKKLRDTKLLEEAGKTATEAVEHIRTVQALNKQKLFIHDYRNSLEVPFRFNLRQVHVYSGVFAFSQSLVFFMYALSFYLGSVFVLHDIMSPLNVYRVFFAIAFCGQTVGQISAFIPDVVKARLAASLVFYLAEHPTEIDSLSTDGKESIKGNIQLKNVHFRYPTRKNIRILRGLNLSVKAGDTVALVGHSGCGKSTVMGLLERFYNPNRGSIFIDDEDITNINIKSLRGQMAIVSQEPTLFDSTIEENICYGLDEPASHDEVVKVAKLANIHDFIMGLPMGYETNVGEKGTQLSGGQKQRIAIARALIRNPSILLLDEATSALDTESEKVVQEALEAAQKGRTSLVIAHRLSTIQNADVIIVVNEGRVVEKGTHYQLMKEEGIYKKLCETQMLIETSE
uniref:Multidrug resistance protein 1 n=1 Tax=Syphacia muris TaxID=451379 RepID=A0A0N5AM76_9BILA